MKIKRFCKLTACAAVACALLLYGSVAYADNSNSISALDTVANFEAIVKGKGFMPNSVIGLSVIKPDNTSFQISALTRNDGTFSAIVSDENTRVAGVYRVSTKDASASTQFTVFPGEMNVTASGLYANKEFVAANGVDLVRVTARVVDEFSNPLPFHEIKLVSSRSADRIIEQSNETDQSGLATFIVSSREVGISTLTATDESAAETLTSRLKVVFSQPTGLYKEIGGDPDTVLLALGDSSSSSFKIENMPATATVNQTLTFTLKAIDGSGSVVPSYSGTVVFSSTDVNVQKPATYTFTGTDQGQHTFNLGLTFRTIGTQKLTVQEQGNAIIKGEKTVEVISEGRGVAGEVQITKPATGTYSVNTLEIAGESTPNSKVKLFDNGQQITEVQALASGRFSFTTSLLTEGNHTFQAESNGVQSDPVNVTIDTTPAQIMAVDITKTNLAPNETTTMMVRSDPDLNSVQATVSEYIVDLVSDPKEPGVYRGTLTAPPEDGDYTVNVILTDKMGNISPQKEVGKLRVDASLKQGGDVFTLTVPSVVTNVKAFPGNGKVTLTWNPAQAEAGIAFYRIYYGTDFSDLKLLVNTKDSKTTWYVPNLQNGTTYYFQVVGIDTKNTEGDNRSDVVSATPSATATGANVSGVPVLCDPGPCPADMPSPNGIPQDGPEVFGMIAAALAGAGMWKVLKKRK